MTSDEPAPDCALCPRLAAFRFGNRTQEPAWHNAPVPTFGDRNARLLVVGLAPGLRGANRTGRPFTGDYAGELLFATLDSFGFSTGTYARQAADGLALTDCAISNAVRCVPPQNKPLPEEIRTCRAFLKGLLASMADLRAVVVLGRIAHDSVLRALDIRLAAAPFGHGHRHAIARTPGRPLVLFDSYHCSRYNTSTGVLTSTMFQSVFAAVRVFLDAEA